MLVQSVYSNKLTLAVNTIYYTSIVKYWGAQQGINYATFDHWKNEWNIPVYIN